MDPGHIKTRIRARLSGLSDAHLDDFVQSVSRELSEKDENWALKRWNFLIRSLEEPRFSLAIRSQTFLASFLAHSDEEVLAAKIKELGDVTPDSLERSIAKRHGKHDDPEVSSSRQRRTERQPSLPMPSTVEEAAERPAEQARSGEPASRARGHSV